MDSGIFTARKKSTVPPNGFRPITRTFRNIRRRACSYAAVEIQESPNGIRGYILTFLKGELHKWKKWICRQGMADTSQAWIYYKESGRGTPS